MFRYVPLITAVLTSKITEWWIYRENNKSRKNRTVHSAVPRARTDEHKWTGVKGPMALREWTNEGGNDVNVVPGRAHLGALANVTALLALPGSTSALCWESEREREKKREKEREREGEREREWWRERENDGGREREWWRERERETVKKERLRMLISYCTIFVRCCK